MEKDQFQIPATIGQRFVNQLIDLIAVAVCWFLLSIITMIIATIAGYSPNNTTEDQIGVVVLLTLVISYWGILRYI